MPFICPRCGARYTRWEDAAECAAEDDLGATLTACSPRERG